MNERGKGDSCPFSRAGLERARSFSYYTHTHMRSHAAGGRPVRATRTDKTAAQHEPGLYLSYICAVRILPHSGRRRSQSALRRSSIEARAGRRVSCGPRLGSDHETSTRHLQLFVPLDAFQTCCRHCHDAVGGR